MNLTVADLSPVRWDDAGLMTIGSPRIATVSGASRLLEAIKTAERNQSGPARVLSLSADSSRRNLTLAQDGNKWEVRLRTTRTNADGVPGIITSADAARPGAASHLVFTFGAAGTARLFLNGQEKAAGEIGGDLSNWDVSFPLELANEADGRRPWRGLFHRVAIYGRDLSPEEVKRNHAEGRQRVVAPKVQTLARYDLSRVPARGGLLTQGSVLTVGGEDASMVARGLFVLHDFALEGGRSENHRCSVSGNVATEFTFVAYDEKLAARIDATVRDWPGMSTKRMFGSMGWMLNGNILGSVRKKRSKSRLRISAGIPGPVSRRMAPARPGGRRDRQSAPTPRFRAGAVVLTAAKEGARRAAALPELRLHLRDSRPPIPLQSGIIGPLAISMLFSLVATPTVYLIMPEGSKNAAD